MARNSSSSPDLVEEPGGGANGGANGGGSFHYRLPFKRNTNNPNNVNTPTSLHFNNNQDRDRQWRSHPLRPKSSSSRKPDKHLFSFSFKDSSSRSLFYFMIFFALFVFAFASIILQTSIMSVFRLPTLTTPDDPSLLSNPFTSLIFTPSSTLLHKLHSRALHRSHPRIGIRPPTIALILGNMDKNPQSLMLFTVINSLKHLGYVFKIYALENGKARSMWEQIGAQFSILESDKYYLIDWLMFQGVVVDSLEVKEAILSLMQDPFCSVPLIWIIQEATLADRLSTYQELGREHLLFYWKQAFSRADVVVFPDFSLPILHSVLDTGNFYVIPGSPADVWAAESYSKAHSKRQSREDNGFDQDDMLVLILGNSFLYNELSWDYAVAMHAISPLLMKYARRKDVGGTYKFLFISGNSTGRYDDALQAVASRLGLLHGSLRHYGMDGDVNGLLLMSDIVVYAPSQDVQGVPPLLIRAMSFGIPIVSPDDPVISKHVVNGVHGMLFPKNNPDALMEAISLLISNGRLSKFGQSVASSGRLLAKNMLASECITSYAKLFETLLNFPSDTLLPGPISGLEKNTWEWSLFWKEIDQRFGAVRDGDTNKYSLGKSSVVYALEENLTGLSSFKNIFDNETGIVAQDIPTKLDWDILRDIENSEDFERREMEEIEERMEKDSGVWDDIYRNARRAEKLKFEANERDEGELERTGQPICIYEIYSGAGSWPFLHHGSIYRGLSLTTKSRRLTSDDVDAVARLPLLNDTYYRDILCEIGGMFSIANKVDNVHKRPWIGFQSWHAAARKDSLSIQAEKVLEGTIEKGTKGDVLYFWARLNIDGEQRGSNDVLTFWSMCDMLNGGNCRSTFENTFRHMYSLPTDIEALPPMPEDGGHWSALHSWAMPTTSFMEFIMFSRMFIDSLDSLHYNTTACFLSSSEPEKKQCYCRVMEVLVNVWAYHSGRKMVYINPRSGVMEEQHRVEERKGFMWAKYFEKTLLKRMDEDMAEAADDEDHPSEMWLWPLSGEVQWQGIYDREREERYRLKMDKKRKIKERMMERMKNGYRQKTLGG